MFKLLRYFSIASLLAFVLIGVLLTFLYRQQALKEITLLEERKHRDVTNFLYHDFSEEIQLLLADQPLPDEATFREEIGHHLGGVLTKLEIFDAKGRVVLEIEAHEEGHEETHEEDEASESYSDDPEIQAALKGEVETELVPLGTLNDEGEKSEQNLIASYLPIVRESDGAVIGVFEVYSNTNELIAHIQATQNRLVLTLGGVLAGLYGVLLLIVGRGQKILNLQHNHMQEQQRSLEAEREQLRLEISNRERAEGELSEANQDLEQSKEDLERSNKELEKFAYVASHDLQEPLRKVQTFGDRLVTKYGDKLGDEGKQYLERMQEATGRMRVLIQDLLAYSRIQGDARDFVKVDLNEVVGGVVSDLEVRLEQSGGRIEIGDLPALQADPLQMRQVFQNLIGNALKFKQPDVPPVVRVSSTRLGSDYQITVKDNGIGFEQQYADKVFEVFQRLHGRSDYEGTGIGLAIVRKVLERHGGSIRVESNPGQGSQFFLTLPGVEQPTPKTAEAVAG